MTGKHTPGPWKVLPEECDRPYVRVRGTVLGERYKVANVVTPVYDGVHGREAEETRANARLIAAAPELLKALKELLSGQTIEGLRGHTGMMDIFVTGEDVRAGLEAIAAVDQPASAPVAGALRSMTICGKEISVRTTNCDYPPEDMEAVVLRRYADERDNAIARELELTAQRDGLLVALRDLELGANTVVCCYDRNPGNFAAALADLKRYAVRARAAITTVGVL